MKLFLASEAKHPESIRALEEFAGGFKNKSIAYIPTAANGEGWESWQEGGTWKLLQTLDAKVTLVQLEDYWNSDPLHIMQGKDIIWFGGGQCGYLMYWIRRTRLDLHIKKLLDEGSIYVGSSAGSMITGKNLDTVEWYIGEQEHGASIIPGLGLVDFDVYPHFEEPAFEQIKTLYKGKKMYLLKNGEEVIVDNQTVKVVGEERIITP